MALPGAKSPAALQGATACRIFGKPAGTYTKDSPERAVGKTCDLAFGYMGGLNAWRKFEPNQFTDEQVETFKTEWRAAHPAIKRFWRGIDRAAWTAVRERGRVVQCCRISFKCIGAFLQLKLPSGRKLSYPQPRIIGDEREQSVLFADNSAAFTDCRHGHGAYGGLWTENFVSAIARDLLAEAMAADRGRRLSDRTARARRDRGRGAGRLRQHRRIYPPHDAQAVLGVGAADRSQCLERAALLQVRRCAVATPADNRDTNPQTGEIQCY